MFTLPTVHIQLDQDIVVARGSATESQGYFLKGVVNLELHEPTRIKDVTLELVGTVSLFSTNKGWLHKVLVKQKWSLLEGPKDVKARDADTYPHPFNIFLPGSLPESVNLEMGSISYVLNVQVKKAAFTRDVNVSKSVTLRRDSLMNNETLASQTEFESSLQHLIHFPVKSILQGESIPFQVVLDHLIKRSIDTVMISVLENVKYRSSVSSSYQTVKQIAQFQFKIQPDDSSLEKHLVLDLSHCPVRFSCNTTYIKVEHELNIQFNDLQKNISIPIWFAPKELGTAHDELPPYSEILPGDLPSYDLISQLPLQTAVA
ncbi:hypothetical protein K7432_003128 [Basidiobolus ranarum]|uniref:Arrestin C-terminal-like domain-containing protein n=1 Tax=Basidiobolus ranarum TaxID=34480 RepID=A0ABR2W6P4_9FUNG